MTLTKERSTAQNSHLVQYCKNYTKHQLEKKNVLYNGE